MKKHTSIYLLLIMVAFCFSCKGQIKTDLAEEGSKPETKGETISHEPTSITRMIQQGRNGEMWMAAFDGVFQHDGNSFTNITDSVSSSRFFSILEDRVGEWWFGSIGSGVYRYDGKSFQNLTTEDGLLSSEVVCIYQDRAGDIWFGANGGVSHYDGHSFRNYVMRGDSMAEEKTGYVVPNLQRPINEVNVILEDREGKMWLGTRGNTFVYDGTTFVTITHDGRPFKNVRWIIEDRKGHIWLGGADGFWHYDGKYFTKITRNFTGYIYEDRHGNIWTSSQSTDTSDWILSRYDAKSLYDKNPTVTQIESAYKDNKGMIFGISEAPDGSIWFGGLDGVYRYDGMVVSKVRGGE